jgi:putative ABC transport system ATP-binding protein
MADTQTLSQPGHGAAPGTWENGALIRVRELSRIYRQGEIEVHALRGANLDIAEGEFTALAGPSGSGKTTMLNMIGALDSASACRHNSTAQAVLV